MQMNRLSLTLIAFLAVSPLQASSLQNLVAASARAHGVPVGLAHGVTMVESRYQCGVTGGGAQGIMQVKPATARGVGITGSLHNCAIGIEAGMRVLKQALRAQGGNLCAAATHFNQGSNPGGRCSGYGRRVMSHSRGLHDDRQFAGVSD
jgi:soluble lytic murein transglycosylase-like protein